jgi:hypothetical protein
MAGPAGSRTDGLFNIRFKAVPGDSSLVETIVGLSGQLAKGVYGLEIGGTDPSTGKSRFELYDAFGDVLFTATFNTEGSPAYQQLNGGNRMFGVAVDQTSGCNIRLHRCLVIENNLPFHFVSADECREFNGAIKENDSIGDYGYGCPSELSGTKALKRYKKSVVNRLNQTHTVYYVTTSDSAPAGWVSFPFTRSSAGGPAVPLDVYVAVP